MLIREKRQALPPPQHLYHSTWGDKTLQLTAARVSGFKEAFFNYFDFIFS